jgi:hypothetical protein
MVHDDASTGFTGSLATCQATVNCDTCGARHIATNQCSRVVSMIAFPGSYAPAINPVLHPCYYAVPEDEVASLHLGGLMKDSYTVYHVSTDMVFSQLSLSSSCLLTMLFTRKHFLPVF